MNDYNDLNNEDGIQNVEQENRGQSNFDPYGAYKDINNISNRIKSSRMAQEGEKNGGIDVSPKADPSTSNLPVGGESATTGGTGATGASAGTAGAAGTGTAGAAGAGTAAAAGTGTAAAAGAGTAAAAGAGTAAAAGATAAASAGAAAFFATPAGWIVLGVGVLLFIVIVVSVILGGGDALAEATGTDEKVLVCECEDDKACQEICDYMNGEAAGLQSAELFKKMVDYCTEQQSFGQKLESFFHTLFTGDDIIRDGCDLARVIEKYTKNKEEEVQKETGEEIVLSRGLITGTLQLLYDGLPDVEATSNEENKIVDTSSPNQVLSNIAASGLVTAKDIKALVEYAVYRSDYTYYTWGEISRDPEYDCDITKDSEGKEIKTNCKTLITYGCEPTNLIYHSTNPTKYLMFLKYGGSYIEEYNTELQMNKYIWNKAKIGYGDLGEANRSLITIKNQQEVNVGDKVDPATSFQEITSYNTAFESTSKECKFEGKADESINELKSTAAENEIYEYEKENIKKSLIAFPTDDVIDTESYQATPEDGIPTAQALLIPQGGCKLNNITKESDTVCELKETELFYGDGFMYANFPQYKYWDERHDVSIDDLTDEKYKKLGQSIETQIDIIDSYEDHLNMLFGFKISNYEDPAYFAGLGVISSNSSCLLENNKAIRLVSCNSCGEDSTIAESSDYPGGASYIDGKLVANETITMEEYIKGTAYREIGKYITSAPEAVKFQMILSKTYMLANSKTKITTEEIQVPIDGCCFQAYRSTSDIPSENLDMFTQAYAEVKDYLLYYKDTSKLFPSYYANEFQEELAAQAKAGVKFNEMLESSAIINYDNGPKGHITGVNMYKNAELASCNDPIPGGNLYNGDIETEWPLFKNENNHTGHKRTMFKCRKMSDGRPDFHAAVDISAIAGEEVISPLDGKVIRSTYSSCGNGMVDVQVTIPGSTETAVLQYTHLNKGTVPVGTLVTANVTVLGTISTGENDTCSSGSHLDFKVYNVSTNRYYNPSVFISNILNGDSDIPTSTFIRGYGGSGGAAGYDKCCAGREGNYPLC